MKGPQVALRPAGDGAGVLQVCASGAAARQDERMNRIEGGCQLIGVRFEPLNMALLDSVGVLGRGAGSGDLAVRDENLVGQSAE